MNLIINASDALEEKSGVISITTGEIYCDKEYLESAFLIRDLAEASYIFLEISDTGIGMDKETKEKIFDPFFSTKFTGRGLGLAAVLGIIRGHKGAVKVYSEPNKGTTFKILLPCSVKEADNIQRPSESIHNWRGSGTILIVDDEEAILSAGKESLENYGFKVLTAVNGKKAVELYAERKDDITLVLLDMTMPVMNGDEAFREMRRINKDVKVVLSSGYNEQDTVNGFAGKGLAGFLQKPYKTADLLASIRDVIEK